jgi:HEAT repeat protein
MAAATALGNRRVAGAVPALEQALDDPSKTVRRHAARALAKITGKDYSDRVNAPR